MNKPRRLGRGLEALLGQIPGQQQHNGPIGPVETPEGSPQPPADTPHDPPASHDPYGGATGQPYGDTAEGHHEHQPPGEQLHTDQQLHTDHQSHTDQPLGAEPPHPQSPPPRPEVPPADPSQLSVELIDRNPHQPRQDFDPSEIHSLAESLRKHGLLQPVVVRRQGERYQLVAGERRLRAAQQAGWADVPVKVIDADDRTTAELAIIENLQRKDLGPLEKAASFQRYLETYACTQDELAGRLEVDRSTVANLIRLLELPEPVREALREKRITAGHARALLPLGEENEQVEFCRRVEREGLNVRQTESLVQETIRAADAEPLSVIGRDGKQSKATTPSEHILALEQELKAALGMKVKLTHNARGRGKLVINFRNHDEFERLRHQLTEPVRGQVQSEAG